MSSPYRVRSSNESWLISYADLITNLLIFFVLIVSASAIQTGKMEKIMQAMNSQASTTSLSSAAEEVQKSLKEQNLEKDVSVDLTDEGLEIAFNSGVTFASGSATILPSMEDSLNRVFEVVKPYTTDYHMAIEGHTDERPMTSTTFKSNWELSSARAMSIRERLEAVGVDARKIRVEAYANNKPLEIKDKENLDREAFLARQRRVVIRLF
ncbi:MAG: flagellar motor protein MotB [Oligoflexales bacterium]